MTEEPKPQNAYQKYYKHRMQNEPEFRAKMIEAIRVCRLKKYKNDEEFRDKVKTSSKNCYNNNTEFRERKKNRALDRYYELKALKFYQSLFD